MPLDANAYWYSSRSTLRSALPAPAAGWNVVDLTPADRSALRSHFQALDREDRRLRFGTAYSDESIARYLDTIDFESDAVLGVYEPGKRLVGAAHVARVDEDAELGVSVLNGYRSRGLGSELLSRAADHARTMRVRRLYLHCLAENAAMLHLAVRNGMRICRDRGEADAWLELEVWRVGSAG